MVTTAIPFLAPNHPPPPVVNIGTFIIHPVYQKHIIVPFDIQGDIRATEQAMTGCVRGTLVTASWVVAASLSLRQRNLVSFFMYRCLCVLMFLLGCTQSHSSVNIFTLNF